MPEESSIFTAECVAVYEAIKITLSNPNKNYRIFSDSLSALQCLADIKLDIKINPYILLAKEKYLLFLESSNNSRKIEFYWIPSHSNIEGNEKVDKSAKNAAWKESDSKIKTPYTDYRQHYKQKMFNNTKKENENDGMYKGKLYFQNFISGSTKPWFWKKNLPRKLVVSINRCRSNHYNLASSLARVGIIEDPSCSCGYEEQNLDHILWQCPLYDNQRSVLYGNLARYKQFPPFISNSFLSELKISHITLIIKYFQDCNLNI